MAILRLRRLFGLLAGSLALLFAVLGPESTRSLGFLAGYVYWLLHIGFGLGLAVLAAMGLARWLPGLRRPPLLDLALAGVLGSLLFAPLALGLEQLFAIPELPDADPDWMDRLESRGGAWAAVAEWLQLAPPYLAAWLCINVAAVPGAVTGGSRGFERVASAAPASGDMTDARARPADPAQTRPQPGRIDPGAPPHADESSPGEPAHLEPHGTPDGAAFASNPSLSDSDRRVLGSHIQPDPAATSVADAAVDAAGQFLAQLPPAIGDDVISIRADLHYLHVRTRRGQATVLGGLAATEAALGARGLRVHRSYWVALAHVRRVSRGARGWSCQLSDGTRVPISRRRTGEVRRLLGSDFVIDDGDDRTSPGA
jgi:hypothetical protein